MVRYVGQIVQILVDMIVRTPVTTLAVENVQIIALGVVRTRVSLAYTDEICHHMD